MSSEVKPFIIHVPCGINDKTELLVILAREGRFPPYFGYNWDALFECLCDFTWLPEGSICIEHEDIPFADNPDERETYLSILNEAVDFSKNDVRILAVKFNQSKT